MDDGSIRIEEATEEALGTYTCVPYNTLGTMGQSAPARLVLKVSLPDGAWPLWWAVFLRPAFHACVSMLPSGPPVFHGATRLGVQAGGRPGAAHSLRSCRGPLPCHHLEEGTWALKLLHCGGGREEPVVVLFGTVWTGQMLGGAATLEDSGGVLALGSGLATPPSSSSDDS